MYLQQIAKMFADIQAKLETLTTIDERLSKVETHLELENHNEHKKELDSNCNEHEEERGPLIQYEGRNV